MPIPISDIANNEVGSSVRSKLNDALDYVNVLPLKIYRALITQTSTNNPVVTVLANTIGSINWVRDAVGQYSGNLSSAFPSGKTFLLRNYQSAAGLVAVDFTRVDANTVNINSTSAGVSTDGLMTDVSIEIAIYN